MEKTVENLDAYIKRLLDLRKKAEEIHEELEELNEEFTDPYGINQELIESSQEEGEDWETDVYSPLQDLEIYNVAYALDERIGIFMNDKEELCCKKKNDNVYKALLFDIYKRKADEGVEPIMVSNKEYEDLYDTLYMIVNTNSKEDFVKHMFKTSIKENN